MNTRERMMDKHNPNYREILAITNVTLAEATIAWFYSGKKQPLISNETRFPVYADGVYDCTDKLQQAMSLCAPIVYLPKGHYQRTRTIKQREQR